MRGYWVKIIVKYKLLLAGQQAGLPWLAQGAPNGEGRTQHTQHRAAA